MRRLLFTLPIMLLCGLLFAGNVQISVDASAFGQDSARYPVLLEPGQPMLNYYSLKILLPFGEEYRSAELSFSSAKTRRSGIEIKPAGVQIPISRPQDITVSQPDPQIYQRDSFFPEQDFEYLGTQYFRGYGIALFNVYPLRYNPVTGETISYTSFELNIESKFSAQAAAEQARFLTFNSQTLELLQQMVANPQQQYSYADHSAYRPKSRTLDPSAAKSMIIITGEANAMWFEDYALWRESKGISTAIYSTDYIYANYTGVDNAEKVRNFIIDAYSSWADTATPLEYVILGGDDEIVPERGVFGRVGSTRDNRMPSDLYFSNLDGDWNANGNDIYGEMQDDTDMIPELHIGRFPAETQAEFNNIFRKIKYYVDNSTFSNNIAIFYGENLNNDPLTWGGDYKDDVANYLPDDYAYSTQYQRDGSYSSTTVWNSINSGVNVMNHMGHANETYLMGQGNSTIGQLQNTEYGFLYSQGCYPAAFDQRTSGDPECIGEHLLTASGGLFSFIGNTRYGWYMPGGIDGASQYYDRQYFIGLFEEGHPQLGKAHTYSLLQNLNAALQSDVMRWCYMEVVLFGDPSVSVKLPDPQLPMLSLESYEFDDSQGDNDGIINPGETIRFHPVISNSAGWASAEHVTIRLESVPDGMQMTSDVIVINQILPGQSSPEDLFLELALPDNIGFGRFTFQISVESLHPLTNLSTGVKYFDVSFEITLFDGRFPWEITNSGKSAPMVVDIDADGSQDIVFADVFGGIYMIGNDGLEFDFFEHPDPLNIFRSGAMAQMDNEGGEDFIFAGRSGHIYAMTTAGELIFDYVADTPFIFTPMIADISSDGAYETIAGGLNGKLHVVDASGETLPGFPLQLPGTFQSELAVGQLEENGPMMIAAGTNTGDFRVIGASGIIDEDYSHNLGSPITGAPIILDRGRIAVATNTHLYLLDRGGVIFEREIFTPVAGGLITADLDQDDSLDIIFVTITGKVWAVSQTNALLGAFPVDTNASFNCPPLIADIDADGQCEIILHSYLNSIYAYHASGSMVEGFPFFTTYNGATPGTLVDFDNDGYFKLISGFSNGILMSNLRRPSSDLAPWTVYRGSLKRQGSAASSGHVGNADAQISPALDLLKPNYPNPFNPNTTIAFELAKAGAVRIDIFNARGQKVRELLCDDLSHGSHTTAWDGTDDNGRSLASGIYLYRMISAEGAQTRKMLLLK
ncbi:MAG: C25 family cysteine peptidase [Candidatus Cloacimonadaceae bacterium]|nr:C25 family cysteine peptidase [Candidatus Cloacimonadota bacterium]MDY0127367.1 C25 family cysteine peptidase [Candidatus Cloacimonadaceae bacterium]MCB5255323.1 C25 family cysteine peptidase [Candidatus Cloacimonadota bacterium]MCK9178534.1 C25 family cysteine peptidase [Candidatus Cloacimonadota bacterium]MCK9242634.1 C25 family cysteine peptidase [Candidatus Cloacimonadota bacterium]